MNYKKMGIKKRITNGFGIVMLVANVAAILGILGMLVISNKYADALRNYGFSQGDIGSGMTEFAETRSALRAAIGFDDEDAMQGAVQDYHESKDRFLAYMDEFSKTVTPKEKELLNEIMEEIEEYWELSEKILEEGVTTDEKMWTAAQELAMNEHTPLYNELHGDLSELMEMKVKEGDRLDGSLTLVGYINMSVVIVMLIAGAVISLKVTATISKSIESPIKALKERFSSFAQGQLKEAFPEMDSEDEIAEMVEEAKMMASNLTAIIQDMEMLMSKMAGGDFSVCSSMQDQYKGDFDQLNRSMNILNKQMNVTLREVDDASGQVSVGSHNLAEAAQSLAEGATEQANAVEKLQATFAGLIEGIIHSSEYVENTYEQAKKYAVNADNSRTEMINMTDVMNRINETSNKIVNIIGEIEDIASQTNLLSLNAAIEAARAGEAGRGFAVVADQIRSLAEQSAKSAVDTRELIESSLREIKEGNIAVGHVASSIEEVAGGMKEIADSAKHLNEISAGQAEAMNCAQDIIETISEVVSSNSATAEETSATSQELSAQAVFLNELVKRFVLCKE